MLSSGTHTQRTLGLFFADADPRFDLLADIVAAEAAVLPREFVLVVALAVTRVFAAFVVLPADFV